MAQGHSIIPRQSGSSSSDRDQDNIYSSKVIITIMIRNKVCAGTVTGKVKVRPTHTNQSSSFQKRPSFL